MIEISDLHVSIGAVQVLHGVAMRVAPGELVSVVGANGAGKTTLLRALSGLLPIQAGRIVLESQPIGGWAAFRRSQAGLVQVPQGRQVIPQLSVQDNLLVGAQQMPGLSRNDREQMLDTEFERFPALRERRYVMAGALSGGEQQMLAVSRALMMRPRVLMLDEPSLGLAPRIVELIFSTLRALATKGMAVLLVEQAAMGALKVSDRALVLRGGRIVLQGTGPELLADPSLVRSFLG